MTSMNNNYLQTIDALWTALLKEDVGVMRRVDGVNAPFYLMACNEVKSFLVTVNAKRRLDIKFKQFENVDIHSLKFTADLSGIVVSLTNPRFYSVFLVIAADMAASLAALNTEEEVIAVYSKKINQWQSIFNKRYETILTAEQQLGLYGELYFIKELIDLQLHVDTVLESWQGALKEDKDFLIGPNAIEIKTSSKPDNLVKISNIRQLDEHGFDHLVLHHYTFVKAADGETTLPALVSELRDIVAESPIPQVFEEKLICAGYFDKDAENYKTSYSLLSEDYYRVIDGFPRITPQNAMNNVLDVNYIIDLNAVPEYKMTYQEFVQIIKPM